MHDMPGSTSAQPAVSAELPGGSRERFAGYGVMGVPFASGDILAMRRWPASSLGEPYTSVWHRDPRERWTIYSDVPPNLACPRFFGSAISEALVREIDITWTGPRDFSISLEREPALDWRLSLSETPATRDERHGRRVARCPLAQRDGTQRDGKSSQ